MVLEAEAIRLPVADQAESARAEGIDVGSDLSEMLLTYVEQIRRLSEKHQDLSTGGLKNARQKVYASMILLGIMLLTLVLVYSAYAICLLYTSPSPRDYS